MKLKCNQHIRQVNQFGRQRMKTKGFTAKELDERKEKKERKEKRDSPRKIAKNAKKEERFTAREHKVQTERNILFSFSALPVFFRGKYKLVFFVFSVFFRGE
jgi:hypothetical protein